MTVARDTKTGAVVGQVLPMAAGGRGSVPGWLKVLTRDGVKRIPNNGTVRLEEHDDR